MTKRITKSPQTPVELHIRAGSIMALGLDGLETQISRLKTCLDNPKREYDQKLVSNLAWLTKQVAQVAGEARKIDAHRARKLDEVDESLVFEWFANLDEDRQAHVLRQLQLSSGGASVLG